MGQFETEVCRRLERLESDLSALKKLLAAAPTRITSDDTTDAVSASVDINDPMPRFNGVALPVIDLRPCRLRYAAYDDEGRLLTVEEDPEDGAPDGYRDAATRALECAGAVLVLEEALIFQLMRRSVCNVPLSQ